MPLPGPSLKGLSGQVEQVEVPTHVSLELVNVFGC